MQGEAGMTDQEWEQLKTYLASSGLTPDEVMLAVKSFQTGQALSSGFQKDPPEWSPRGERRQLSLFHAFNGA